MATACAGGCTTDEHDLADEWWDDPYPALHHLRATEPVRHDPETGNLVLTRYDDVAGVLRGAEFGMDRARIATSADVLAGGSRAVDYFIRRLHHYDPPDHGRIRSVLAPAFAPPALGRLRLFAEAEANRLLEPLGDGAGIDVVTALAEPLTIAVLTELIGLPVTASPRVASWLPALGGVLEQVNEGPPTGAARGLEDAWDDVAAELVAPTAPRRTGLLGLVAAALGSRLDLAEAVASVLFVLSAGYRTTRDFLAMAFLALLDHPAAWRALVADELRVPAAVTEALRYDSPTPTTFRRALAPAIIGGRLVPPGSLVICVLVAANRDPARFSMPDQFHLDRPGNVPLSFGGGRHHCLGAGVSRVIAEVAFETVARRRPGLALACPRGALAWRRSPAFRGPVSLPVTDAGH